MNLKEKIKVLFERRKRTNYHNKYKPSAPKYIIMIVIFMCIRFIPATSGSPIIDDALNDLAVGATASVVVTWMLDSADCMKKNKAREEKERMIFAPHTSELLNLGFYVSSKAIQLGDEIDAKSFSDWLSTVADPSVYTETSESSQQEIYEEIRNRVISIRQTVENLMQQYTILVETGVVYTHDFAMYAGMQKGRCDHICDLIANGDYEDANAWLSALFGTYAVFFDEEWVNDYSEADAKG